MFMLNPDSPNPSLFNMLLHGATVTFDGGCYLRRVETEDGFCVEAGIGLSPHKMRCDLAEGELCLRKVAEWFAAKRGEILKNAPRNMSQGIEPHYQKEYVGTACAEQMRHESKYDEVPLGPVYHGQVAPAYQQPSVQRVGVRVGDDPGQPGNGGREGNH